MIRNLYRLFPKASLMARLGMLTATRAILEGILLSFLVPILAALLRPEPDLLAAQPWLVIGAIGLAFHGILTIVATPIGFAASSELAAELRQRIMRHVTTLPLGWFTDANKARLARAVTADVGTIAHLAVTIGSPAITATVLPTTIAIVTFVVDWRMALLFASIGLIAFLALRRAARIAAEAEIELERTTTEIANRAIEFGQAQPVLRAAGRATTGTERMQEALAAHRTTYRRGLARSRLPDLTFTSVVMMGFVLALTIGTNLLLSGATAIASTIAVFVLAVRFLEPIGNLIELVGALRAMDNAVGRVRSILGLPTLPVPSNAVTKLRHSGISFQRVSFSYGGAPALREVSFDCRPGTMTALVGPSGSGKTTITRLIARFFDVDSGCVRIGDDDVRQIDPASLMSDIAIILQDVYLFDATIEENLRVARPEAGRDELKEACKAARLDEVIARLPHGLDTRVGEGGAQLSGGERQRVSIARAFLKKARIILIDEASSALDPQNERAVSEAIASLAQAPDRTMIVIAHHPTTIACADQVLALDQGRVVEFGPPSVLRDTNGIYARIVSQHADAQKWQMRSVPTTTF